MDREREQDFPIELGAVSTETRGMPWGWDDFQGGLIPYVGLSAD